MKLPPFRSLCTQGRLWLVVMCLPVGIRAGNVDWTGNGDPNATGLWETDANWTAGAKPTSLDNARLLDVTTGTREITVSSGFAQTIKQLTITQATAGAFNVLNLNDDLTISGSSSPFVITATAGQDSIVTNIAAGKTLLATNAGSMTVNFGGELNLAAGSVFKLRATGSTSDMSNPAINGAINASGAGAQVVFQPDRFLTGTGGALLNGAITVTGSGSTLEIARLTSTDTVGSMTSTFSGDDGSGNAVNVGDGARLTLSTTRSTATFNNRVTVGANGVLNINQDSNGGTATNNFNGGLVLGAGAEYTVNESSTVVTLDGTSSMGTGAVMTLKYTGTQATGTLTNDGTFTMDGAAVKFDWATTGNNNGTRGFTNNGDWTLKNGSSVALISSTGHGSISGGFGNFRNVSNSGTLSVESGSTVGFESLINTGVMTLGSSTAGVSDTQVVVGSPANTFTNIVLNNGYTTGNSTLNVLGDAFIGRPVPNNSTVWLDNGTDRNGGATGNNADASTGNTINIGDGTVAATLVLGNGTVNLTNATGNTINLKAGATLLLQSLYTTASATGTVVLTNSGTFTQGGTLQFQGNFNGYRTFTNNAASTYRISGQNAVIEALPGNASGTNIRAVEFTSTGLITGASSYDKLTYTNSTGTSSKDVLVIAMTGGSITPGNGHGLAADFIGTLEFVNTDITLSGATKLSFEIGGPGNDNAPLDVDLNPILTFDRILLGASRTFDLGTGATLDIWLTNRYATTSPQTYTLIDTGLGGEGTVTGSFANLLFQGEAVTDEYTVNISNGMLTVTLAAGLLPIPEPSSCALWAGLGVATLAALRRRRVSTGV